MAGGAADKADRNYKRKAIEIKRKTKARNLFLSTHIEDADRPLNEAQGNNPTELKRSERRNHFANTKQLCAILQIRFDGAGQVGGLGRNAVLC